MATRIFHFGKRIKDCTDSFLTLVFGIFVMVLSCGLFFSLPLNQAREARWHSLSMLVCDSKGPISSMAFNPPYDTPTHTLQYYDSLRNPAEDP